MNPRIMWVAFVILFSIVLAEVTKTIYVHITTCRADKNTPFLICFFNDS